MSLFDRFLLGDKKEKKEKKRIDCDRYWYTRSRPACDGSQSHTKDSVELRNVVLTMHIKYRRKGSVHPRRWWCDRLMAAYVCVCGPCGMETEMKKWRNKLKWCATFRDTQNTIHIFQEYPGLAATQNLVGVCGESERDSRRRRRRYHNNCLFENYDTKNKTKHHGVRFILFMHAAPIQLPMSGELSWQKTTPKVTDVMEYVGCGVASDSYEWARSQTAHGTDNWDNGKEEFDEADFLDTDPHINRETPRQDNEMECEKKKHGRKKFLKQKIEKQKNEDDRTVHGGPADVDISKNTPRWNSICQSIINIFQKHRKKYLWVSLRDRADLERSIGGATMEWWCIAVTPVYMMVDMDSRLRLLINHVVATKCLHTRGALRHRHTHTHTHSEAHRDAPPKASHKGTNK